MMLGKRSILVALLLLLAFSLWLNVGLLVKEGFLLRAQPSTGGPSFEELNVSGDMTVGGKVGIGVMEPAENLHIFEKGNTALSALRLQFQDAVGMHYRTWEIRTPESSVSDGKFAIRDVTAGQTRLIIDMDGNVGIGVTKPQEKLQVSGNYIQIDGAAGEKAHIGGDGHPVSGDIPDIEIGSVNPQVVDVSFWNPVAHTYMNLYAQNGTFWGNLSVSGAKQFIQPHPSDPAKEIVYASLEGPEVGTYIRGMAQLQDGEAIIDLPEHFSLVTSNEGVTVQLTCIDECNGLRVVRVSTKQIAVKELLEGKSNARFYYLVQGVRKGYEDHQVIQEKPGT